jgi:hypothetical protein
MGAGDEAASLSEPPPGMRLNVGELCSQPRVAEPSRARTVAARALRWHPRRRGPQLPDALSGGLLQLCASSCRPRAPTHDVA